VDHNKLWKILQEMGIPDHLTCRLKNLFTGKEATVRTGHGTADCFQIRKEVRQGGILSLCLFKLYAEYIMRNPGLDEAQAGTMIARRNINNLIYADDTSYSNENKNKQVEPNTTKKCLQRKGNCKQDENTNLSSISKQFSSVAQSCPSL